MRKRVREVVSVIQLQYLCDFGNSLRYSRTLGDVLRNNRIDYRYTKLIDRLHVAKCNCYIVVYLSMLN